jgi:very-short-patch-repair endonuclease
MRQPLHPKRIALLEQRARLMRYQPSESEAALWRLLSAGALGVAWKKQVRIGGSIADFVAPRKHVIVEVDGGYHQRRVRADARRDAKLARLGYRVVRVEADRVLRQPEAVLALLAAALAER